MSWVADVPRVSRPCTISTRVLGIINKHDYTCLHGKTHGSDCELQMGLCPGDFNDNLSALVHGFGSLVFLDHLVAVCAVQSRESAPAGAEVRRAMCITVLAIGVPPMIAMMRFIMSTTTTP